MANGFLHLARPDTPKRRHLGPGWAAFVLLVACGGSRPRIRDDIEQRHLQPPDPVVSYVDYEPEGPLPEISCATYAFDEQGCVLTEPSSVACAVVYEGFVSQVLGEP